LDDAQIASSQSAQPRQRLLVVFSLTYFMYPCSLEHIISSAINGRETSTAHAIQNQLSVVAQQTTERPAVKCIRLLLLVVFGQRFH
jgi:hypothetical protein